MAKYRIVDRYHGREVGYRKSSRFAPGRIIADHVREIAGKIDLFSSFDRVDRLTGSTTSHHIHFLSELIGERDSGKAAARRYVGHFEKLAFVLDYKGKHVGMIVSIACGDLRGCI